MDDKFVDVDFTKDPNYVFGDITPTAFRFACGNFEDAVPTMSDAEIDAAIDLLDNGGEAGLDDLITRILNQGQEGSCVGNATTQGHQVAQAAQFGKDKVIQLSAISLYKQIGSSAQSGSSVDDAMSAIDSTGILPLDTPENRAKFGDQVMPPTGFKSPYPANWKTTAAMFRGFEFRVIRTTGGLWTALCQRKPVIVGRQGHSICYCRPTRKGGSRKVKYANSWGQWGDAGGDFSYGFGYDSESLIRQSASWCFAITGVTYPQVAA